MGLLSGVLRGDQTANPTAKTDMPNAFHKLPRPQRDRIIESFHSPVTNPAKRYPIYHGPFEGVDDLPDRLIGLMEFVPAPSLGPFMVVEHEGLFEIVNDRRESARPRRQADRDWAAEESREVARFAEQRSEDARTREKTALVIGLIIGLIAMWAVFLITTKG